MRAIFLTLSAVLFSLIGFSSAAVAGDRLAGVSVGESVSTLGSDWQSRTGEPLTRFGTVYGQPNAMVSVFTCGTDTIRAVMVAWAFSDVAFQTPGMNAIRQPNDQDNVIGLANALANRMATEGWDIEMNGEPSFFANDTGYSAHRGSLTRTSKMNVTPHGSAIMVMTAPIEFFNHCRT